MPTTSLLRIRALASLGSKVSSTRHNPGRGIISARGRSGLYRF
jgi:hypothetical protein